MTPRESAKTPNSIFRVRIWYGILLILFSIVLIRLFYLQVIKHDFYRSSALSGQFKEYEISPARGVIEAHDGENTVPIVLNEEKFTLYADPVDVVDVEDSAKRIEKIIGGDEDEYQKALGQENTRYSVIKKKLSRDVAKEIDELTIPGVRTRAESYRTYPQGTFASQVLGFVNDEGDGKYGIEEYLNESLEGTPGQLKAVTDAQGVPLAANGDNVLKQPTDGERVVLTIDVSMQQQLEAILKTGLERAQSKSGSAMIMDPYTGEIKAMANYPSYDPAKFFEQEDAGVFTNELVSSPLEVGSIMKPLTTAAALNTGSVSKNQTFYDPGVFKVDGEDITNVEEVAGAATRPVVDVLRLSLNTGATWLLQQMGGGKINQQARDTWHNYMVSHYQLGKKTNIEQGYEEPGYIPDPNEGFGLNIQYANSSFGQGMSATPLQMGAAISSVINGGTYYQPRLVDSRTDMDGQVKKVKPVKVRDNVVSGEVSKTIIEFMQEVVNANFAAYGMSEVNPNYMIGGKTGTAQITRPEGGYYEDRFNGMFMGFVGGKKPQYVIVVRVNEPGIDGYAGSRAAGPVFTDTVDMLINNFAVTPKK